MHKSYTDTDTLVCMYSLGYTQTTSPKLTYHTLLLPPQSIYNRIPARPNTTNPSYNTVQPILYNTLKHSLTLPLTQSTRPPQPTRSPSTLALTHRHTKDMGYTTISAAQIPRTPHSSSSSSASCELDLSPSHPSMIYPIL